MTFHRQRPAVSDRFALPYDLYEKGIRRMVNPIQRANRNKAVFWVEAVPQTDTQPAH